MASEEERQAILDAQPLAMGDQTGEVLDHTLCTTRTNKDYVRVRFIPETDPETIVEWKGWLNSTDNMASTRDSLAGIGFDPSEGHKLWMLDSQPTLLSGAKAPITVGLNEYPEGKFTPIVEWLNSAPRKPKDVGALDTMFDQLPEETPKKPKKKKEAEEEEPPF